MQRLWLPASAINFRDLGGLPTASGGEIRPGMLFRSATPQFLTVEDARRLTHESRLRLILDLRFERESAIEGHGALEDTGVRRVNVPVVGAHGSQTDRAVLVEDQDTLGEQYISYVELSPHAFVESCRALATPDNLPALVHCAAGKDRTGVFVAILLSALGVPDDAIIADYALTTEHMPSVVRHLQQAQSYARTMAVQDPDDELAQSRPDTMAAFLAWVNREHGSARDLLLDAGLEPGALDELDRALIVRAAA